MMTCSTNGGSDGGGSGLKKGPWSAAEDAILVDYVKKCGEGNWNAVQRNTGLLRSGKSCRLRWANHLRPNLKKGAFTPEEERLILELHAKLGNKWARISAHLPGRTDNEVKNYWNTRVKRRIRQGLPLYPHEIQTGPSLSSPPHQPPSTLACFKTTPTSLSLCNPISLPCSTAYFNLHSTTILSPPPASPSHHKFPMQNPFLGQSVFAELSSTDSFLLGTMSFNLESSSILQTQVKTEGVDPYDSLFDQNSELPSNQLCQRMPNEAINDEINVTPNVRQRNSGLLDALLQEARDKGELESKRLKRDNVGCGGQL
ncbi:hypothetical protein Ancab_004467 [Ancistrocladus abbreviatus]